MAPAVYDDKKGNRIYQVPRRYPGLARVVDAAKLAALPIPVEDVPQPHLKELAAILEQGPEAPAETRWETTDRLRVKARVGHGQTIFVQVAYDTPWRAYSGGRPLAVSRTQLNFLRIDAPPGEHDIALVFELPFENLMGRIVTGASLAVLVALIRKKEAAV